MVFVMVRRRKNRDSGIFRGGIQREGFSKRGNQSKGKLCEIQNWKINSKQKNLPNHLKDAFLEEIQIFKICFQTATSHGTSVTKLNVNFQFILHHKLFFLRHLNLAVWARIFVEFQGKYESVICFVMIISMTIFCLLKPFNWTDSEYFNWIWLSSVTNLQQN